MNTENDSDMEYFDEEVDMWRSTPAVQPYMYEPLQSDRLPLSSENESDESGEDASETDTQENVTDPSEWCICGRCGSMPTQKECRCCQNTNIVDGKLEACQLTCITEHDGFIGNCLNIHVLEASYYEFIQSEGLQEELIHETYRYLAYRRFARWIYKVLPKKDRRVLPACVVTAIRKQFPSERYTGFQYAQ